MIVFVLYRISSTMHSEITDYSAWKSTHIFSWQVEKIFLVSWKISKWYSSHAIHHKMGFTLQIQIVFSNHGIIRALKTFSLHRTYFTFIMKSICVANIFYIICIWNLIRGKLLNCWHFYINSTNFLVHNICLLLLYKIYKPFIFRSNIPNIRLNQNLETIEKRLIPFFQFWLEKIIKVHKLYKNFPNILTFLIIKRTLSKIAFWVMRIHHELFCTYGILASLHIDYSCVCYARDLLMQ